MNIRKVKIDDYEQVIDLYQQLYDAEKFFDSNLKNTYKMLESNKQIKKIKKRIKSRNTIFLVAEKDDRVIGLIDGYLVDSDCYRENVGYLDHLCVDKKYRGQGVATMLIEKFKEKMKKRNVSYIKLNAFSTNFSATNLYKKLGFEEYSIYYRSKI